MDTFILKIQLGGSLRWLVQHEHKSTYSLAFNNDFDVKLINPNFYGNLINQLDKWMNIITNNGIIIESSVLFLEIYGEKNYDKFDKGDKSFLSLFFKHFRYLGNQVKLDINSPVAMLSFHNKKRYKRIVKKEAKPSLGYVSNRYVSFYFDWNNAKELKVALDSKANIPIYTNVLLDALQALYTKDFRKAIIYATIASESMLSIKLSEANEKNTQERSTCHRQGSIKVKNDELLVDPIFRMLSKQSGFAKLLHELPLYTINKSLLLEKKQLYNKALKLYSTRNKIVHTGDVPESKDILNIDEYGAIEAYNTAVNLFNWMGVSGFRKYAPLKWINQK